MTNARYHTFRLQNLFVSCPNIFIKQPYSIFFLVWSAVPIIYILSPSPFIFVNVLLLRHGKTAEREQNREFVHFWVQNPCILCWQVLFLLQFFFQQNNQVILPRLIQLWNTYLYCAMCNLYWKKKKILHVFRRNDYKGNSLQWKLIFWDVSIICNKEGILFWWKHIVEGHCLSQNRTKEGPTRCVAVLNILFIASNLIFLAFVFSITL